VSNPENEVELETVELNEYLDMGEALHRLQKNPDFIKVIMEGYLTKKVKSSVSLLAVPGIKQRGERGDVMEDLVSVSNLQYFFAMIENFYEGATQEGTEGDPE
jgi:hypothetical protein